LRWFFVYFNGVQIKRPKRAPLLLALAVLALVCGIRCWNPDYPDRLERMTYDLRLRAAQKYPIAAATNFAFVSMEESTIAAVKNGSFGYRFGLYWPRQVYGRVVEELSTQGAKAVVFDVLFGELRTDHPSVSLADGNQMESDDFFALQMRRAGNVLLAATPDVTPPALFTTNALSLGNISAERDSDGILRRVKAFYDVRRWHPQIAAFAADTNVCGDLDRAVFVPGKMLLPQNGSTNLIEIPLDAENNFSLADFLPDPLPPGTPPKAKVFTTERIWDMGIVLAAQQLGLDLAKTVVDLPQGKIFLRGTNGVERILPVDAAGFFWVNWGLHLWRLPLENVLAQDMLRLRGETNQLENYFAGKLVVVGSAVQANDLTDRGATPLENDTLLVSRHWNIANSIITGQFIRRTPLAGELMLIALLGVLTALVTWELRAFMASVFVFGLLAGYAVLAVVLFIRFRWWLPLVYPLGGAVLLQHFTLVLHRVVFEEKEKRRVKSVFSKLVSPHIVNELLAAEKLALGGTRREVTVLFADIRGFTAFTDQAQEQVAEFVRTHQLTGEAAEKYFAESARDTLEVVNLYLATVAEAVKKHDGTLDKYIGDCVMAFWNAPIASEQHALNCVRAAIAAQRAIRDLNDRRLAENPERAAENERRVAAGLPPKPLNVALKLGTGINTGPVTVGLMGSDEHGFNYTVFGREINLASRLEGVSGISRILVSEATLGHLQQHDPALAATCVELEPARMKGFQDMIRNFEVPWK